MKTILRFIPLSIFSVTLLNAGWTRTYGGSASDEGHSIQQTSDGGYIIVGWTSSFSVGSEDVYLIKTDASGDTVWTQTYGGEYSDWGYSIQQTSDGGYIIAGWTESFGAGENDVYLIKTDASGDSLWTQAYGGSDADWGFSVQETSEEGYIIAGRTNSFGAGQADVYLIKTDSLGLVTVEEPVTLPESHTTFEVVTSVGIQIQLISCSQENQTLNVFDASGRQVDEVFLDGPGTVTWPATPNGLSPGVYFIVPQTGNQTAQKVILVR